MNSTMYNVIYGEMIGEGAFGKVHAVRLENCIIINFNY
jgi:hypothetical protein